ncbi:hypothetical protein [Draconibacterium orientale]|uniref:hypothetical protein n=1 Tax=Draconibacterium orientale TaxID=1168034 RepID=UPI002ABD1B1B|nr:hypothetical protein [Draconibacterium orientale]
MEEKKTLYRWMGGLDLSDQVDGAILNTPVQNSIAYAKSSPINFADGWKATC